MARPNDRQGAQFLSHYRGGLNLLALLGLFLGGTVQAQEIPDRRSALEGYQQAERLKAEGKLQEAVRLYERLAAVAPQVLGADSPETTTLLNNLAMLYDDLGRSDQAEPLYQRSLAIKESKLGKDHPSVATTLNNLAALYQGTGQYERAGPLYQRSLAIREARLGKDHLEVANCLNNLAALHKAMGQYEKAEQFYQRSLQIREAKLGADHPQVANNLNNLAFLYWNMAEYARAEPLYQRSCGIYEAKLGKEHLAVGQSLHNLARLYASMGEPARAEPLYERSQAIYEARLGKDHPLVASCLADLGQLYAGMGQYAKAEPLLQRSLSIREAQLGKDHPEVATSLSNLGALCASKGEPARAEVLYQRSLRIQESRRDPNHPLVLANLTSLAWLSETQGRMEAAAALTEQARRISCRLANHCLPFLSEAEQMAFLHGPDEAGWQAALSLGLRHAGEPALASRSAGWLLNGKGVAQHTAAGGVLLARETAGQGAGNTTTSELNQMLRDTRKQLGRLTMSTSQPGREAARLAQLERLSTREKELTGQLRQAGSRSVRQDPWIEPAELQKLLPDNVVFIDLARFEVRDFAARADQPKWRPARYAAWITPARGEVQLIDLGPAGAIENAIQEVRQAFHTAPQDVREKGEPAAETALRERLATLARLVLHPLLPHIGKTERWVLSPDSNLWLVPWAALPLPNGKYAIEEHALSCVVSGRSLVNAGARSRVPPGQPLVLADPDFDLARDQVALQKRQFLPGQDLFQETRGRSQALPRGRLQRVSGASTQAKALSTQLQRYAGAEVLLRVDKEAVAGALQTARHPRVVVLVTQGYFLPPQQTDPQVRDRLAGTEQPRYLPGLENPLLRCGLFFSGRNNATKQTGEPREPEGDDDGVLTGLQIVGADLRGTELVVLNAGETEPGDGRNGEAVGDLRQSFQLAGAESVVAALWQVPGPEATSLLSDFFANLAKGQGKADALRNAQVAAFKGRRARNGSAHPFFWAAWTQTGDAGDARAPALQAEDLVKLDSAAAYNERGRNWLAQGRYNLARADFEAALQLDPQMAKAHNNIGFIHHVRGEDEQALACYGRAAALDNRNSLYYQNRAAVHRRRGDYAQALADLNQAVQRNDKDQKLFLERACVHRLTGDLEGARGDCDQALKLEPKSAAALLERAEAALASKTYPAAERDLDAVLQQDPKLLRALLMRGSVYLAEGKLDQAGKDLNAVLGAAPDSWYAYRERAVLRARQGDPAGALADWREVIRLQTSEVSKASEGYLEEAYLESAQLHRLQNQIDQALTDVERALKLRPKSARAHAERGASLFLKKDYDEAIASLGRTLELNGKNVFALAVRGNAYHRKGEHQRAIADCTRAIELDPSYAYAYQIRAVAHHALGNADQAARDSAKANELSQQRR